jgi:hypothetical protein
MVLAGTLVSAVAARASLTAININNTGGGFTSGALETDWTVTSPTDVVTTPFVTEGSPSGFPFTSWGPDDLPTYGWISAQQSYTTSSADAVGVWTFATTFNLTGLNPSTAVIMFKASVDNSLSNTSVTLNGHDLTIANLTAVGFDLSTATYTINVPADFVAGINTLQFAVTNGSGTAGNPVGLLVDFTSADANSPEPGTGVLIVGGFVGMIGWARRRTQQA